MAAHLVSSNLGRDSALPSEAIDATAGEAAGFARLSPLSPGSRASVAGSGTSTAGNRGDATMVTGRGRAGSVLGAAARVLSFRLSDGMQQLSTPNAPWGEEGEGSSSCPFPCLSLPILVVHHACADPPPSSLFPPLASHSSN